MLEGAFLEVERLSKEEHPGKLGMTNQSVHGPW